MRAQRILAAGALAAGIASAGRGASAPDWVLRARSTEVAAALLSTRPAPDAVVLWQQQIVTAASSGGATKLFERQAVKILTREGQDAGTFKASYDDDSKVDVEGAWTLHADGSAEQLNLEDVVSIQLAHAEFYTDQHIVLFRPPRLLPGDVASYALSRKSRRDVYQWVLELQGKHPIAAQEVVMDLPRGWSHHWRLTSAPDGYTGAMTGEGGAKASYQFGAQRGVPNEEASPPGRDRLARMEVAIEPPAGKFPDLAFKTWKDVAAWFYRKSLPARTDPPAEIVAALQPQPSDAARWVQDKVRYVAIEAGEGGYVPREPAVVARRLYGDCKDKAFLFMSLLARRGIEVLPVLTRTRDEGSIDPDFPSPVQFNHVIVAVRVAAPTGLPAEVPLTNGPVVLFDPTAAWTPYGQLPGSLSRGRGLVVRPDGGEFIAFPTGTPAVNTLKRTIEAQLNGAGRLEATVTDVSTGVLSQRAAFQEMAPNERVEFVQRFAQDYIAAARTSDVQFVNLDERLQPMEAKFSVSADGYARKTGSLMLLPVLPFPVGPARISRLEERRFPIDLGSPKTRQLTTSFKLPLSVTVESLPDPIEVDNASFRYKFAVVQQKDSLVATETYEVKKPVVPPSEIALWKAVETAAARAAGSKAVIVPAP